MCSLETSFIFLNLYFLSLLILYSMTSYKYLSTMNQKFVPRQAFIKKVQFSLVDPTKVRGRDIIFCQCNYCVAPNRETEWYETRGLPLAHGTKITREKVQYACQLFLSTTNYRTELPESIHMWHIILMMHEGLYVCRGVSGLGAPPRKDRHQCWWHQCQKGQNESWCWIKNHYYTDWTCVCNTYCCNFTPTHKQCLEVYTGFGALNLQDQQIGLQLVYQASRTLLNWISQPHVNGPPQLNLLSGSVCEARSVEAPCTNLEISGMNYLLTARTLSFLSRAELQFPIFLNDHFGQNIVFSRGPKRDLGDSNFVDKMLVLFDSFYDN